MYKCFFKRFFDVVLSGVGIILLALPMLVIVIIIKIDDPGPALFKQKRVGIHKKHFTLYKFRSMKLSTPHDMPTHLLENPEQYLLKYGKISMNLQMKWYGMILAYGQKVEQEEYGTILTKNAMKRVIIILPRLHTK